MEEERRGEHAPEHDQHHGRGDHSHGHRTHAEEKHAAAGASSCCGRKTEQHQEESPPEVVLPGYRLAAEAPFGQRLTYRIPQGGRSSAGGPAGTSTESSSSRSSTAQCVATEGGGLRHQQQRGCHYEGCRQDEAGKLLVCGGCRQVRYCSRACQAADWKAGHRALCSKPVPSKQEQDVSNSPTMACRKEPRTEDHADADHTIEDSSPPIYMLEVLQNLQSLSVTILHQPSLSATDIKVSVHEKYLLFSNGSHQHKILLHGVDIDGSKASVQILEDHVLVKIPLRAAKNTSIHNDSHLLEAQKLPSPTEVSNLYCRSCGMALLEPSPLLDSTEHEARIKKVFSLPSIYWLELADFWTCGNCCAFRQFPTDEIKATPNVCFVSDTFLMLHSSQVIYSSSAQGNKQLEGLVSAGSEVGWSPIVCKGCATPIGIKEIPPIIQDHLSLRLFTYRISNKAKEVDQSQNYFRNDTLERFVAKHFLACSSLHTVYRFIVKAFETGEAAIVITLMNWRSSLASNASLLADHKGLNPIVKLRYIDCKSRRGVPEMSEQSSSQGPAPHAEEVVLWQAECDELLGLLNERNRTCLPPSMSSFSGMPMSFLYSG